jgi:hypothetical protein
MVTAVQRVPKKVRNDKGWTPTMDELMTSHRRIQNALKKAGLDADHE